MAWPLWLLLLAGQPLTPAGQLPDAQCCSQVLHPQVHMCAADVLIRARITGERLVFEKGESGHYLTLLEYKIKQIKLFKSPTKLKTKRLQYLYTTFDTCGAKLEAFTRQQYVLSGRVLPDGKVFIPLCNYAKTWESISDFQKEVLYHLDTLSCSCQITLCLKEPCVTDNTEECLWTDWVQSHVFEGLEAQNFLCQKQNNSKKCQWFQGPKTKVSPTTAQHPPQPFMYSFWASELTLHGPKPEDFHVTADGHQGPVSQTRQS